MVSKPIRNGVSFDGGILHAMTTIAAVPEDPDDRETGPTTPSPSSRTPEGQGSNIPLGWKPTRAEPIPVVRCTAIKRDGNRCKQWSLRGADKCIKHGGQLPNVQKHAEATVEAARLRLIGLADMAVDTIEDLVSNASNEGIRLKAAQDVLDRSGVRGALEVDITVQHEQSAAERVQERLGELASRLSKKNESDEDDGDDDDVIDAEVVEE